MNDNVAQARGLGQGALILHGLAKNWWALLLRGLASIVFGVLAFAWPGITIVSLVILYGAYALVDGLFALYAAISGGKLISPAPNSRCSCTPRRISSTCTFTSRDANRST